MYLRFFWRLSIILLLVLLQITFVSGLPDGWRELNLVIIFLIFFFEFNSGKGFFWWSILVGFLFDLYFSGFFGFFVIFWPLVFLFASILSVNFFTNRSLYSFLGLAFFTYFFYYLLFNGFFYLFKLFSSNKAGLFLLSKNFWLQLGEGLVVNLLAVALIFYLTNLISDRLKPVFIIKK
jgi:hypothetical protein